MVITSLDFNMASGDTAQSANPSREQQLNTATLREQYHCTIRTTNTTDALEWPWPWCPYSRRRQHGHGMDVFKHQNVLLMDALDVMTYLLFFSLCLRLMNEKCAAYCPGMCCVVPMTSLQELANAQPPIPPQGRALALVCTSLVGLVLSYVVIGLRIWCRAIWLSKVWGLDDTLAVLGLIVYTVACTYAILSACYGLGIPDSQLNPLAAYQTRALEYNVWWEICYLISAALVKTSVGVASIRIALERRYRYTVYGCVIVSNAACIGGVIWELAACRPIATRWDTEVGSCYVPGLVPIAYAITTITVITDAGYALVPVFILQGILMRPRVKYALMVVLAMGSTAAIASVARYPFVPYFNATENYLYNNVWIPLLSEIECAVGLIAGSLPSIGKMFHFFDAPIKKPREPLGPGAWAAPQTIGGSPLSDHENSLHDGCHSRDEFVRRPSMPKLSTRNVKGMWSIRSLG